MRLVNFSAVFTVASGNTVVVSFILVPSGTRNGMKKEGGGGNALGKKCGMVREKYNKKKQNSEKDINTNIKRKVPHFITVRRMDPII